MKKFMPLVSFAFAALCSTGAALAGGPDHACQTGVISLPCASTGWDLGIQALYLQQRDGTPAFIGFRQAGPYRNWVLDEPNWGWGFQLDGSYHFSSGNDVTLSWLRYHKKTSKTYSLGTTPAAVNTVPTVGKREWDMVNLVLAQMVNFGQHTSIRFFAGAQYNDYATHYSAQNYPAAGLRANGHFTFKGFGPRLGTDFNFKVVNGFSVYIMGALSLLAGDDCFKLNVTNNALVAAPNGSKIHFIPEIEGKLGARYTIALANRRGRIMLDAGYMWLDMRGTILLPSIPGFAVAECNTSLQGAYFGVNWLGFTS